jgi:hypothetical protein
MEINVGDEPILVMRLLVYLRKQKYHSHFFFYKNGGQEDKTGPLWVLVPLGRGKVEGEDVRG